MSFEKTSDSLGTDRLPCPVCSWPMWLMSVQRIGLSQHERHDFICPLCDHMEHKTILVWRKAGQSHASVHAKGRKLGGLAEP